MQNGEHDLQTLLKSLEPKLHKGEYVFCTVQKLPDTPITNLLFIFRESGGITVILEKAVADALSLAYTFVASWISLTVHSSLQAVGLTAAISKALTQQNISCNIVAAFYHDHIFVATSDSEKAMKALEELSITS